MPKPKQNKRLLALQRDVANAKEDIIEKAKIVKYYSGDAPSTVQRRRTFRKEFIVVMRGLYRIDDSVSDEEVFSRHFQRDIVIDRVAEYITGLLMSSVTKGMIGEMIKAGSLRQRVEAMWFYAIWEFSNGLVGLYQEWSIKLGGKIQQLADEYNLETGRRERYFFGEPELRLLFDYVLPGTIAYSRGYEKEEGDKKAEKTLLWRDITFHRVTDADSGVKVAINFLWLKGQRPVEDALGSSNAILRMDDVKRNLPVFVAQRGANTEELSEVAVGREKSIETAKQFAGHIASKNLSYAYYDYGLGDQDLTTIRLDPNKEAADRMTRRQEKSAPAIVNRGPLPDERKRHDHVDAGFHDSEEVQAWEDAYVEICAALKARFEFERRTTMKAVMEYLATSAEDWEAPGDEDDDLPKTWVHWCLNSVNDRNTAGGFLKAIALKRKTVLKRHRRALQREFDKQWQEEGQYQTVEGLKKLLDESKKPTTLFTLPTGTTRAAEELRERRNIKRALWPAGVENDEEVHLDEDDDLEPNESEDRMSPLEALAAKLDENESLIVEGDTGNDFASIETGKSEAELTRMSLEMRAILINLWRTLGSASHNKSTCRLCVFNPEGASESQLNTFFDSEKMCMHVIRGDHVGVTTFNKLIETSFDMAKKKFFCIACDQKPDGWADKKTFKQHMEKKHEAFVKALAE
ncbi:hypothetical protein HK101_000938 [Irineochytrium annulatum]|nr:hypothetical protein HK101_000938 [Irineochytrium annulatum]